jgi:hypothetical protein
LNLSFLPTDMDWICRLCGEKLQPGMVELQYLGNVFKVELPICPKCSKPLISEDLALGRMLEVEKLLEDK